MNEAKTLYHNEPQYVYNVFSGNSFGFNGILPCGLSVENEIDIDIQSLSSLPKGRIWYSFNTDAFIDTPSHNVYNDLFLNTVKEQDFSISLLTVSKSIMKYVNVLQGIRSAEAGVWFSSDTGKNNSFTERLDILRRLYFSDIYTIAYLNTDGDITDIVNLAELVSGLCHRAYLYGSQNDTARAVNDIFAEHKKTVFYIQKTNNGLLL